MLSKFESALAFRYLKPRKKEGFLSITASFAFIGIMLGVATLIIVMSVMNGFRADLLDRILGFGGHIEIMAQRPEGIFDYSSLIADLQKDRRVVQATPMITAQAMVIGSGKALGVQVNGISLEDVERRPLLTKNIMYGDLKDFNAQENSILIGYRMANKLRVFPGEEVTLVSPDGNHTAFGTMPRTRRFKVAAVFKVGMSTYDESVIFMNLKGAQTFFRLPGAINSVELFTTNPYQVQSVRQDLTNFYAEKYAFYAYDWMQTNSKFFGAVQVERNVMFIILTLIILIASFNIISTLVMLVKNKSRDIAILRTMGASRASITNIFFLAGTSISVIGTSLGVLVGLVFCWNIEVIRQGIQKLFGTELFTEEVYFLSQLPAKVNPIEVGVIVIMAISISFFFSIFPALRASRLDPVEALRYE